MRPHLAIVSVITGLLVGVGPANGQSIVSPADRVGLPEEVDGGVIVELADGDRFRVTLSPNGRKAWASTYDATTNVWTARVNVLPEKNLVCRDVDARGAGTGVAVTASCDKGSFAEDQAPTHSQAIYSPDTRTWHARTLPGEAYQAPGISPDGSSAIWPVYQGWVTWTGAGFRLVRHPLVGQEYTTTAAISDSGDVSVLYGGRRASSEDCRLHVLSVSAAGAETRQELDVADACADVKLTNTDAHTVLMGYLEAPALVTTLTRPDTASPWAVTAIAPQSAPGLVGADGPGKLPVLFLAARDLPLLAMRSTDGRVVTTQAYDPVAQRWESPRTVANLSQTCRWDDNFVPEQLGVFAALLKCTNQRRRVLVSTDGLAWGRAATGRRPIGVSPDGDWVSVSSKRSTSIFSREAGRVVLPLGASGRCAIVQPMSPDSAIRLTANSRRRWPTVLQESTTRGWRTTRTKIPPLRTGAERCLSVETELYNRPTSYTFFGATRMVSLTVAGRGTGFKVRRVAY